MGGQRGIDYWKARALALEAANRRLHERLSALAALLPPDYLDDLEREPRPGELRRPAPPVMNAGEDGPHPTPADVEPELLALWARTAHAEHD